MSAVLKMVTNEDYLPNTRNEAIKEMVTFAADIAAPVWPLKTFIACNPLQGFEYLPFEKAAVKAESYKNINAEASVGREAVNREMIKWLGAFLDEGQATISMPNKQKGFYRAFNALAKFDSNLQGRDWLKSTPEAPEDAIAEGLERLNVPAHDQEEFIRQMLSALPGWSGYVKWRNDWQNPNEGMKNPITLIDYVAVRMILTCALWPDAKVVQPNGTATPVYVNELQKAESDYRQQLLEKLIAQTTSLQTAGKPRPQAQLVFCIDVRSEPFRRSIEAQGEYETLGFAGFFGLPVRVKGYDDEEAHDSCPVLLKPCHQVHEHPAEHDTHTVVRHDHGRSLLKVPKSLYQSLKYHFGTPFALVEMLGPWYGLRMLGRTFAPFISSSLKTSTAKTIMPHIATDPALDDITIAQQADYGEGALRMMGLTENFAPLVVFCGHGSSTNNNAYGAALDCGACGGNHGGGNAKILAKILNKSDIRSILTARGLAIPGDTIFLAAEHDTTTDHVEIYGNAQGENITKLQSDLAQAEKTNALSRCATFGMNNIKAETAKEDTARRSHDWAEVRPEWGLARNAAFIVGPRELTRQVDLEGRCFLHSYDPANDREGKFLTTILTAPMVVAQWINNQYLFSTLDNVFYGGGSKITKNITGKIGVMQGNASDLMHGLPLQSVYAADAKPYHEPLRLLTVVYAPRGRVQAIIDTQQVLQKLLYNGWVTLTVIDHESQQTHILQRDGSWKKAA